ncbi:MAG: peptidoglycan-binding protein [Rhodobacteraceae bacterium]|nr:peptidoglycan-binding protein [Paracoccaceae bacterium]
MARGKKTKQKDMKAPDEGVVSRAGHAARDNPVAVGGAIVMALTGTLIIANAMTFQPGRHPAPLFVTRDRPAPVPGDEATTVMPQPISPLVLDIQMGLRRLGIYEGSLDGLMGPATERAIRNYQRMQGRPETGEASDELLAIMTLSGAKRTEASQPVPRGKPHVGEGYIASFRTEEPQAAVDMRLVRVQTVLSELGYGPLVADGVMGDSTLAAIRRFELDRDLPRTDTITQQFVERLEAVSGMTID